MSDDAGRQDLADQLLSLPVPGLVGVLSRVLPAHASTAWGIQQLLVLAQVIRQRRSRKAESRQFLEAGQPIPGRQNTPLS